MMTVLGVIGAVLSCIIGVWKLFGRKARERRERVDAADAQFKEGMQERDPSKITASNSRLNRE